MATALLRIEKIQQQLAQCTKVDEAREIRDKAKAVGIYLRQKHASIEAQQDAIEISLWAERRMGALLSGLKIKAGNPRLNNRPGVALLKQIGITASESSFAQRLHAIDEGEFRRRVIELRTNSERLSRKGVLSVSASSTHDGDEWGSPPDVVERARRGMGSIDTDPASSERAQQVIRAATYYTKKDNGLDQPWSGNVWLNPPFSQPLCMEFTTSLSVRFHSGAISKGTLLVNNATETAWFQDLVQQFPACLYAGRLAFLDASGKPVNGNRQGQVFFLLGWDRDAAVREFGPIGTLVKSWPEE